MFAAKGAKVAVVDIIEDNETVSLIQSAGGTAMFLKCDVANDAAVQAMVAAVIAQWGTIDCAFNNAGVEGLSAPVHECTEDNWDRVIAVNQKGVWLCMKYELQQMQKQGHGAIVNCASIAGLVGFTGLPAYVASKHAIVGLTKNAALENAKSGIRVNAVCPGVIRTPMIDRFTGKNKEAEKAFENMEPVGRMGEPEEVAETVVWLCSEHASFVTGQALAVDGGWIAQ